MASGPGSANGCSGDSDMGDSRKRPLDGEFESGVTKRSHQSGGDGTYHLKILVPSVAAGAIIGKGGETIAQLQKETGARVKMSKANDFYPGTTERVCLITGTIEAIMHVHNFIMEKIRDKPDPNAKPAIDFDNKQPAEREKQVKILVPNSTAGMIIGKGGNYIKQIKEESGSYVQISQKAKDQSLSERCITVIGEMEFNRQACAMILSKIMEDPQSGSCLNVSYADVTGPVANFNPTGSPFANSGSPTNSGPLVGAGGFPATNGFSSPGGGGAGVSVGANGVGVGAGGLGLGFNIAAALMGAGAGGPPNIVQFVENLKVMLRGSGYSDQATVDIGNALNTLAGYGVLGLALSSILQINGGVAAVNGLFGGSGTGGGAGGVSNVTAMDTTPAPAAVMSSNGMSPNNVFGPIGSISGGVSLPVTPRSAGDHVGASDGYDPFRRTSPAPGSSVVQANTGAAAAAATAAAGLHINNNSFGLGTSPPGVMGLRKSPTPGDKGLAVDPTKVEMEVGENIVGAILGPGGKSLVEIQHFSGANIQISKKGIFSPGTRNRIVTITGTPNGISTAQYLIEQRISEEEAKRARQNMLSVVR